MSDTDDDTTDAAQQHEYEVGIRAYTHETVVARSPEEAAAKAQEQVRVPMMWTVDETDPEAAEAEGAGQ